MRTPPANPLKTRSDLQKAFTDLEAGLLATWDNDATGPTLSGHRAWYGPQAARLEIVARYLWGLIPFTAGGGVSKGWPLVLDAIVHGTDPRHPQFWGNANDNDQRSVEMAAFGLGLTLAPKELWEPLSREQKDRLASWLGGMVGKSLVGSNWQYFRLMVTMGLRNIDRAPANADAKDQEAIDRIDSMYMKDGWYADGGNGQRDYYIPMAFHFYGPVLAALAKSGPVTKRADEWKQRAAEFAKQFVYWFDADGAALAFGRSLAYRFAQGAFWSGCGIAGIDTFSPGQTRGLLMRHMRWWWKQPMLNADNTLSLGYAYPNLNILEPYNASGSPYWAFKAMAALALPATHPFWSEPEAAVPAGDSRSVQTSPNMLIERDGAGHVVSLSAGQWHSGWPLRHRDAKYAKLSYSTYFGPCVGANHEWLAGTGIDGTYAIQLSGRSRNDGTPWQCRGPTKNARVESDHVVSDFENIDGVSVRSWQVPAGVWHLRVHRVTSDKPIQFAEGAFSVEDPSVEARTDRAACAKDARGGRSGLVSVSGPRGVDLSDVEPNSSLYHSRTKTIVATTGLAAGTHWLATLVFAAPPDVQADFTKPPQVEWEPGKRVAIQTAAGRVELNLAV